MNKPNQWLLGISVFLGITLFSCAFAAPVDSDDVSDAASREMILHYVNVYRAKHHLPALKLNAAASQEALKHSQAMASKSIPFGHAHFSDRIQRLYKKFENCRGGAENVAFYKTNAKRLVDGWIASPGHRRNIEGQYNVTGIGIAHGKPGWAYYTQIFVRTDSRWALDKTA